MRTERSNLLPPSATSATDTNAMIVVSLTTIRSRLARLDDVLASLLNQSLAPDAILLNVSHEPFLLDEGIHEADVERYAPLAAEHADRIHVRFVENTGSYRKIFPALAFVRDSEDVIVTADDDIPYPVHWVERLVARLSSSRSTPAYRCRLLAWDRGFLQPYEEWPFVGGADAPGNDEPRLDLLPTSGGGIAYRRSFFDDSDPLDALRRAAPMQDDIALRFLMLAKGIGVTWTPSDASGSRFEEFRAHASPVDLYRYNRRAGWLGLTPNDAAVRRVAALLYPRASDPRARGLLDRARRRVPLHRLVNRRLHEAYWEFRSARRRRSQA